MEQAERQKKLEADAIEDGLARYRRWRDKHKLSPARSRPGIEFLRRTFEPVAAAIGAEQEAIIGQVGRRKLPKYAAPLLSLDPDKLTLITLHSLFDLSMAIGSAGLLPTVTHAAQIIGKRCRQERKFDLLRRRARDVHELFRKANENRQNVERRARRFAGEVDGDWSASDRDVHLGIRLITLAEKHSQAFERIRFTKQSGRKIKTPAVLRLTEETHEWLAERHLSYETLAAAVHRPMIVPPRPWTALRGGGYLTIPDTDLVKHHNNKRAIAALNTADLTLIFAAVNALQQTPWRINARIYTIMRRAWERGDALPGLPREPQRQLPGRLPKGTQPEILKRHKAELARIHRANTKARADQEIMQMRMRICGELVEEERLYFPYQIDNRGRAYPIPQAFSPQSDDTERALLDFAEGKPLGDSGARWLAVHLANTFGEDKVSFEEREQWIMARHQEIIDFAENPHPDHRFWKEAEKPWCFLAASMEWAHYCHEGPNFTSYLPIAMDGTCNGLQHLSAMGRDAAGGRATNLVPGIKPADLYQQVADLVKVAVEADAKKGRQEAREWLGKITRKLVKRATMTTPYGVTPKGIRDQLIQDGFTGHLQDKWEGVTYLTDILEGCIGEVVVKAKEIMDWLKGIADFLAEADRAICWTTPTGLPVVHEYRSRKARRVVTKPYTLVLYDRDVRLRLQKKKQVNAITPNFVHSMDAAHMMFTVNRLHQEGLYNFAMVHDSYAVHACDVDRLHNALREEFVRIYRKPILEKFLTEQRAVNPGIMLPDPPRLGNLDITDVLRSDYFFA